MVNSGTEHMSHQKGLFNLYFNVSVAMYLIHPFYFLLFALFEDFNSDTVDRIEGVILSTLGLRGFAHFHAFCR